MAVPRRREGDDQWELVIWLGSMGARGLVPAHFPALPVAVALVEFKLVASRAEDDGAVRACT